MLSLRPAPLGAELVSNCTTTLGRLPLLRALRGLREATDDQAVLGAGRLQYKHCCVAPAHEDSRKKLRNRPLKEDVTLHVVA